MRPLAIDLFCGLGGWAEGLLAEGYEVVGFDIERHDYGTGGYPGQLVLQDVLTIDGARFKNSMLIVASPPCQEYSYRAMPWKRAKALPPPDNSLFEACFRIQREASEAAGRKIPMVVENVRGAQKWVGRAKWHYGSYYLWGDIPALMPIIGKYKSTGMNWSNRELRGQWFTGIAGQQATKTVGHVNKRDGYSPTRHLTNQSESDGVKHGGDWFSGYNGGLDKDHSQMRQFGSKSKARKRASALIAKIPLPLARHIAWAWGPKGS